VRTVRAEPFRLFSKGHEVVRDTPLSREVFLHRKQRRAEEIEGSLGRPLEPKFLIQADRGFKKWRCAEKNSGRPLGHGPVLHLVQECRSGSRSPGHRQNRHSPDVGRAAACDGGDGTHYRFIARRHPDRPFPHARLDPLSARSRCAKTFLGVESPVLCERLAEHNSNRSAIIGLGSSNLNLTCHAASFIGASPRRQHLSLLHPLIKMTKCELALHPVPLLPVADFVR
jgi:hypothetical protein